jgi:hypothetical protein
MQKRRNQQESRDETTMATPHEPYINRSTSVENEVFDSYGVLEHILSYVDAIDLVSVAHVSRRWKEASRADFLWKDAIPLLWVDKIGVQPEHPLFWRSLFTKDTVQRMTIHQIRMLFQHPLLAKKKEMLAKCIEKSELQRFMQVHMLDVMSDEPDWHHFFRDLYFGSYACSKLDSKRAMITSLELCTPFGFDMYFKIAQDEVEDADRSFLTVYAETEGVLLYHHSTCYFEETRDFSIVLNQHIHSLHPTDLKWRWLDIGKRVQVGPYPPLTITRRKDWGWKLENLHVVLLFRDRK